MSYSILFSGHLTRKSKKNVKCFAKNRQWTKYKEKGRNIKGGDLINN